MLGVVGTHAQFLWCATPYEDLETSGMQFVVRPQHLWLGGSLSPSMSTLAVWSCVLWLGTTDCSRSPKQQSPVARVGHVLSCSGSPWQDCLRGQGGLLWVTQSELSCGLDGVHTGFPWQQVPGLGVEQAPGCSGSNWQYNSRAWGGGGAGVRHRGLPGLHSVQSPGAGS